MPVEWVWIRHPKVKGAPARVTKESFEKVWGPKKGYEIVDPTKEAK